MCEKMNLYFVSVLFAAVLTSKGLQIPDEKEKPVKDLKTSKAEEDMLNLKTHHTECTEESRVDPDLVVKFKAGDWRNEGSALKKWVLCVLNRLGLMSKEGVYKLDEAFSKFPKKDESKVDKLVDECLTTKSLPPADIAWQYVKCLHVKDPHGNFSSISVFRL